jgi:hypothetical protein
MIKVYDDLIPVHLQDFFELSILGRTDKEDECLHPTIDLRCKYESTSRENDHTPMSFTHVLKSSSKVSDHLDNFGLIPQIVCSEENVILREIITARIFLTVPHKTNLKNYAAHTDFDFPHHVCLYYVNNADGPTVFYDQEEKIIDQVMPKKGRVVFFDGLIKHGGGIPRNGPRCIVNYDILTKGIT